MRREGGEGAGERPGRVAIATGADGPAALGAAVGRGGLGEALLALLDRSGAPPQALHILILPDLSTLERDGVGSRIRRCWRRWWTGWGSAGSPAWRWPARPRVGSRRARRGPG
ncbi:MAG: hypothetical protein QM767_19415 [Anaeromyxobacter sp.]